MLRLDFAFRVGLMGVMRGFGRLCGVSFVWFCCLMVGGTHVCRVDKYDAMVGQWCLHCHAVCAFFGITVVLAVVNIAVVGATDHLRNHC